MKLKDLDIMNKFIIIFITLICVLFSIKHNLFYIHDAIHIIVLGFVTALILILLTKGIELFYEGFLFEVSPNKPHCGKGFYGLPRLNFEYIPDAERVSMPQCQNINAMNKAKFLLSKEQDKSCQPLNLQDRFLW